MFKKIWILCLIIMIATISISGCIETNNKDKKDKTINSYKSKFIGTWILPEVYTKQSYYIDIFNNDGTYESFMVNTYDYVGEGTWYVINETKFHINRTVNFNGQIETYALDLDYVFTDNDNTLTYGDNSIESSGNAIQLYRLDGKYQSIFIEGSPSTIYNGSEVNLSWIVIGGSSFSINNGIGNVGRIGHTKIYPEETTEYVLTVQEDKETYTANTTIIVEELTEDEEHKYPNATIDTTEGIIKVKLFDDKAPNTVDNFIKLANDGFYNDIVFHRVIDDFMIQGGGYHANGTLKESPYGTIDLEIHEDLRHLDGAIAMARTNNPNSATSQFYICDGPQSYLDADYAVFGVVTEGINVIRSIASVSTETKYSMQNWPTDDILINSIVIEYPSDL